MLLLVNLEAVGSQFASFWESIKSTRNYDMFFYHFVILFMMVFDDAESVALYSAYVDTPQSTIKSTRIFVLLTLFFVVLMIFLDDAKSVALYSAYAYIPQNTRESTRNYGLFCIYF